MFIAIPAPSAVNCESMVNGSKETNSSGLVHCYSFKGNYVLGSGLHLLLSHCRISTASRVKRWDAACGREPVRVWLET